MVSKAAERSPLTPKVSKATSRSSKYDHVSPALRERYWLPVKQRITYKVAILTFHALHGNSPAYLTELVSLNKLTRNLRSSSQHLLTIPRIDSAAGRRSFSFAAPQVWNSLPLQLRLSTSLTSFRSLLKTHLFPP